MSPDEPERKTFVSGLLVGIKGSVPEISPDFLNSFIPFRVFFRQAFGPDMNPVHPNAHAQEFLQTSMPWRSFSIYLNIVFSSSSS